MLKPGQKIEKHHVPDSPFYVIVLRARGVFVGADGQEREYGPNSLIVFEPGEPHIARALDTELVFVSFLQAVDTMRAGRTGGEIGRE